MVDFIQQIRRRLCRIDINVFVEDYYDSYENPDWKPTPWYKKLFNLIYRWLYFMTGPKFVVPLIGNYSRSKRIMTDNTETLSSYKRPK